MSVGGCAVTAAIRGSVPSPGSAPPEAIAASRSIQVRGVIQRCGGIQCPPGTCDHDEKEKIHRFADGRHATVKIPSSVFKVLRTAGQPLDTSVRVAMEERFGHDFAHVRVHSDPSAARSARAIQAQAYTFGRHIVMGQDRFQPHTAPGMRLLAHELAHVVQQGNLACDTAQPCAISHSGDPSELQAERIATAAGWQGLPTGTAPDAVPVPGSAPLIARQVDAGVPDEGDKDAGAPESGAAAARAEALNDPMYPLQAGCVAEQGACQQYLAGGTPDPGRFLAEYNSRCRGRTKYKGTDVWPSGAECEQAKTGVILDPGKLREFKELLLEYKVRVDAGVLAPDAISAGEAAIMTGLQALRRAGLTEEAITEAARNPPSPEVTQAFAPGGSAVALRVVIQGGRVALLSEPAAATTTTLAGGEAAAGTSTLAAEAAGAAVEAAGAAAGATAAAVAGAVLLGLLVVGLGVLIIWALLQPGLRLDPVAPQLLDEALQKLRDAARRQRQPQRKPRPQPEPLPTRRLRPGDPDVEEEERRGCRGRAGPQRGGNTCHDQFATSASGVSREWVVTTPTGLTESFDARGPGGDTLYEMKTGYGFLGIRNPTPGQRTMIDKTAERWQRQSARQQLVADLCGYDLVWYFTNENARAYADGIIQPRTVRVPFRCDTDGERRFS